MWLKTHNRDKFTTMHKPIISKPV